MWQYPESDCKPHKCIRCDKFLKSIHRVNKPYKCDVLKIHVQNLSRTVATVYASNVIKWL